MNPALLLDTHIVVRWLSAPRRLSREQSRVLRDAMRSQRPVAVSAMSLLEIAILFGAAGSRMEVTARRILDTIALAPAIQIEPMTVEVAQEVAALGGALRDPADRAIICTARVRGLRLVTSDRRIIESRLVPVIA
jgi:PIN domain nuclease of toxin-antitoxin system